MTAFSTAQKCLPGTNKVDWKRVDKIMEGELNSDQLNGLTWTERYARIVSVLNSSLLSAGAYIPKSTASVKPS